MVPMIIKSHLLGAFADVYEDYLSDRLREMAAAAQPGQALRVVLWPTSMRDQGAGGSSTLFTSKLIPLGCTETSESRLAAALAAPKVTASFGASGGLASVAVASVLRGLLAAAAGEDDEAVLGDAVVPDWQSSEAIMAMLHEDKGRRRKREALEAKARRLTKIRKVLAKH